MKVLFLNPEQYVDFENEPSNYQVRLPALNSGAITDYKDFVYQRTFKRSGRAAMNQEAINIFQNYQPDIVINSMCWWQECLDCQTLATMRQTEAKVISIFWDTWINALPHETEIFLSSDIVLVMDSLSNYFKYRLLGEQQQGSTKVIFSPIAVFTDLIKPIDIEKDIDVLMLGSREGQRSELISYLKKNLINTGINFQHIGGLVNDENINKNNTNKWIDWETYAKIINRSKICLSSQTQPDRRQIKGKIFDFLASQTFCLTDNNPELQRFVPNRGVAYFNDKADCLAQISHFIDNEKDRISIAKAGYEWLNRTYSYKAFWQNTLDFTQKNITQVSQLSGVEEAYQEFKSQQDLIIRLQSAAISQLAQLVNLGLEVKRLPVRAEGSYKNLNILNVDERFIIACDQLDIDFVEIGGRLHAITPDSGILKLAEQEIIMSQQSRIIQLGSVKQAKQTIDIISK
jgi:spore maturation protein CgeB